MEIEIKNDRIKEDLYMVIDKNGSIYGAYPSIADAVYSVKILRKDFVKVNGLKICHRITAYIDCDVDCAELMED